MKLPENVKKDMDEYQKDPNWVPESYVKFLENEAVKDINHRQDTGQLVILEDLGLVPDGWGDGMMLKQYHIAYKKDKAWKTAHIVFSDSGSWMRYKKGCLVLFMVYGQELSTKEENC